jgi:hypothetical protein
MSRRIILVLAICLISILLSIQYVQQPRLERGQSLLLTSFTDARNDIAVSVRLTRKIDGSFILEGVFIPPSGYHLYSKDLPRGGTNGQGRPTLLELPPGSQIQSVGPLVESVASNMVSSEPDGPLVYPDGPVTLSLPVKLPPERGWVKDQISLTYTACSLTACKDPTIGRLIAVTVPGALSFSN